MLWWSKGRAVRRHRLTDDILGSSVRVASMCLKWLLRNLDDAEGGQINESPCEGKKVYP